MNKEFIRVRTLTDIVVSSILLISGSVLVVLPTSVSVVYFGFFLLITGTVLLVTLKNGWQDKKTQECYCKKEVLFSKNSKAKILNALEKHVENVDISDEDKGEGLKMDIYYNKQSRRAFIALFEYVPYSYESISPTFEYTIDEIKKIIG
ncbi:MAG: hypothetical protein J6B92_12350 [Paraprevotella sp.]|nr:hypothetical protein [Paraprevotella sp.]